MMHHGEDLISNISGIILVDLLGEKSTRYIKTCLEASIDHLTKFMELRLKVLYNTIFD